jgi:8-oxo-dGTP pyrophosphatase MutT (NUDIX family)
MPWTNDFHVDHESRTVRLSERILDGTVDPGKAISKAFQEVVDEAVRMHLFPTLREHGEYYRVIGAKHEGVVVERFPSPLFGIVSRGAHMTAYVKGDSGRPEDMKIWIAKRSAQIYTYPGKLDSSVAGGVKAADSPLDCIVAESEEEASLDRAWVRQNVKATGIVSYVGQNTKNATVQPVILYLYDLACPPDVHLTPGDEEVEEFKLMTVEEVRDAMMRWEFKTNVSLVMIDFFARHGILTPENEPDYLEILYRLRRKLPVPLSPN